MYLFMMDLQLFATDEGGATGGTDTQGHTGGTETDETEAKGDALTADDVQRMIQSETDRVRTEYVQKLRAAEAERDELKKQAMSEQERQQYEAEQRAKELEEKDRLLRKRELELYAVDQLRAKELPLEFRDFVVADDEDATSARLDTLNKLFSEAVEKAVAARFAESGRVPKGGDGGKGGAKNPFSKDHWNRTEQMRLMKENPELAKRLKAAAGG